MSAAAVILVSAAAVAILAAAALFSLFFPFRLPNPDRIGNVVGDATEGAVPYSIENTGGIPWLSVNGMPYPGSFDATDRRRFSLDGTWMLKEDPGERGLDEGWFAAGEDHAGAEGWEPTDIPATYNPAIGGRTGFLGVLWYRKRFRAEDLGACGDAKAGRRLRLCFEGILLRGDVWLNGRKLGSFEGGFTPVYFDVTHEVRDENLLAVRCDNRLTLDSLPPRLLDGHNPGWHTYAGIYRSVFVEELPQDSVAKAQIRTRFHEDGGGELEVSVLGWTAGDGAAGSGGHPAGGDRDREAPGDREFGTPEARIILKDPDGIAAKREHGELSGLPGSGGTTAWRAVFPLKDIRRWTPEEGIRYELIIELHRGASVDRVVLRPGLRDFRVAASWLLLNGDPLFLKGICRHEDHPVHGASQPRDLIDGDLALIGEMNANYVRLAHYPHCREELDAATEAGLLLSEEIPLYQAGMGFTAWFQEKRPLRQFPAATFGLRQTARRGLLANARRQLIEMIERDRHCPAMLFWSLGNECYTLGRRAGRIFSMLGKTAKLFDPDRPVTVVEATYAKFGFDRFRRGWDGADILSVNSYYGWYFGRADQVPDYLDAIRRRWPDRPLILSEFGAGAARGRSDSDGPWRGERIEARRTYSEEYQEEVLRTYWKAARERRWAAGYSPWVFADFYNTWFPGNPVPNYNLKGVVSADRKPKRAWRALKDMYREDP